MHLQVVVLHAGAEGSRSNEKDSDEIEDQAPSCPSHSGFYLREEHTKAPNDAFHNLLPSFRRLGGERLAGYLREG